MKVSRFGSVLLLAFFALLIFRQNPSSILLPDQSADPGAMSHFEWSDALTPETNHLLRQRISNVISENRNALPMPGEFPVAQRSIESTKLKQIRVEGDKKHRSDVETNSDSAHRISNSALSDFITPGATEVPGARATDFHKYHKNVYILRAGLQSSSASTAESFILVTGERPDGCKTSEGSHLMMKSYKNKVDYCNLHGCKVWYMLETWNQGFKGIWARYPALLRLMQSNPAIRWFMWMDADAILTDFNFSIPFKKYETLGKKLVFPGYVDKVYGDEGDWLSLNTGVFLIRNTAWARGFLRTWMEIGDKQREAEVRKEVNEELKNRPKDWELDDQSAAVYLLRKGKSGEEWRRKVHIEAEYVLHGYFEMVVDRLEEMEAEPPFVTHFCGCNFCSGAAPTKRCTAQFRRALNFADNQLLAPLVALRHPTLNSSAIIPATSSN